MKVNRGLHTLKNRLQAQTYEIKWAQHGASQKLMYRVFGSNGSVGHFVYYSRKSLTLGFLNAKYQFGDCQSVRYSRKSIISESGTSENLCTVAIVVAGTKFKNSRNPLNNIQIPTIDYADFFTSKVTQGCHLLRKISHSCSTLDSAYNIHGYKGQPVKVAA